MVSSKQAHFKKPLFHQGHFHGGNIGFIVTFQTIKMTSVYHSLTHRIE